MQKFKKIILGIILSCFLGNIFTPFVVFAADVELMMPFGSTDADKVIKVDSQTTSFSIIKDYVSKFYKWGALVTGLLAVLMVVVGGVQYMMYGADPGQKDDAKSRITQALMALTLLLLSALILRTINPNFFK